MLDDDDRPVGIRRGTGRHGLGDLREQEKVAKERRDLAWREVVRCQEQVREAQRAARVAAAKAQRER